MSGGVWIKPPLVITDIDDTLISTTTGQLHPIIVPMLVALQRVVDVEVLTARHQERMDETRAFLESIELNAVIRYNYEKESPWAFKMRSLRELTATNSVLLLIDDDTEVLKYAQTLGIPTILP